MVIGTQPNGAQPGLVAAEWNREGEQALAKERECCFMPRAALPAAAAAAAAASERAASASVWMLPELRSLGAFWTTYVPQMSRWHR